MMDEQDVDTPALTDAQGAEVLTLVRTALGDQLRAGVPPSLLDVIDSAVEHHGVHESVWLEGAAVGVGVCRGCGALSVYMLGSVSAVVHCGVEVAEHLRRSDNLGGDVEAEMLCTYRRLPVLPEPLYVFDITYWLDFDGVIDRVFHTTRSVVTVVDEILRAIEAVLQQED